MKLLLDDENDRVEVHSLGRVILATDKLPVQELKYQLDEWVEIVNDTNNCQCFIFSPRDKELIGSFRIEPRPVGWQFTSMWEKRRSEEIISLNDWKKVVKSAFARNCTYQGKSSRRAKGARG